MIQDCHSLFSEKRLPPPILWYAEIFMQARFGNLCFFRPTKSASMRATLSYIAQLSILRNIIPLNGILIDTTLFMSSLEKHIVDGSIDYSSV